MTRSEFMHRLLLTDPGALGKDPDRAVENIKSITAAAERLAPFDAERICTAVTGDNMADVPPGVRCQLDAGHTGSHLGPYEQAGRYTWTNRP